MSDPQRTRHQVIAPSGGFPFIDPDAFAVPSRPCRRSLCPSTRDELPSRCSPVDTLTASPRASDRPPALSRSSRNERANPDPLPPRALLSMIRFCLLLEGDSSTSPPTTPGEQALFPPEALPFVPLVLLWYSAERRPSATAEREGVSTGVGRPSSTRTSSLAPKPGSKNKGGREKINRRAGQV